MKPTLKPTHPPIPPTIPPTTIRTLKIPPPIHPLKPKARGFINPPKAWGCLRLQQQPARTLQRIAQMQPVSRGQRIASRTTTAQHIAQMQPVRRGPCIASRTTTSQCIAQMQPVRRGPRIASRTTTTQRIAQMQPVRRGPRIASRTTTAHRPPHTGNQTSAVRTRFTVLCAGFVWFVGLTFPKFNIYTFLFVIPVGAYRNSFPLVGSTYLLFSSSSRLYCAIISLVKLPTAGLSVSACSFKSLFIKLLLVCLVPFNAR